MQDPNQDTEWNDILRSKGILPPKEKEISEEEIVNMMESTIEEKLKSKENEMEKKSLDELDELEDSEDEAFILEYRRKKIAELKALAQKSKFGSVLEISGKEYVEQVNKAGEGVWVVLHLYKQGVPLCSLLNQYIFQLAPKFPTTKFIKAISTTCIANFPDKNLPSIFVYFEGELKKQLVGPTEFRRPDLTLDEFEFMLGQIGAINTDIKEDPRPAIKDKLFSDLQESNDWSL